MNKYTHNLLKLISENPDLPIIPVVDGEIPGDDCGYWLADWGSSRVDSYLISKRNNEMLFKSDDDVFDVLEKSLTDEELENLPDEESECIPIYDSLPWKKAIVVYINAL